MKPLPNLREPLPQKNSHLLLPENSLKILLHKKDAHGVHCKKSDHYKETCWDLHGKPANWKPTRKYDHQGNTTTIDAPKPSPFTKEQMDAFMQIFKSQVTANTIH
ncbi:hypothetical protein ZIOFF_075451 [Zingiber officinale]|uniref:Uncharacterized protein n=1 Tax=Zingiber officinale TaxID=94328 RepID=A0A8J5E8H6_ZINOF|nr:hypothetical protein ZIOFF_075451 [Zingiber officinale]